MHAVQACCGLWWPAVVLCGLARVTTECSPPPSPLVNRRMDFVKDPASEVAADDYTMDYEGFKLVVDPKSLLYLFGMNLVSWARKGQGKEGEGRRCTECT